MFKERTSSLAEATGDCSFDHPVLHVDTRDPTEDTALAPATGPRHGDPP